MLSLSSPLTYHRHYFSVNIVIWYSDWQTWMDSRLIIIIRTDGFRFMNGTILHNTDWWSFFSLKGLIWMYCWNLKGWHFATYSVRLWRQWPNMWMTSIHPIFGAQKMAETILNSESSDSPGDTLTCCLARLFIWKSKAYIKQAKKQKNCFIKVNYPSTLFHKNLWVV